MITIHPNAEIMQKEPCFEIFKHEGLICCIQRLSWAGNLNGYVAVPEGHPFYEKEYSDNVVVADIEKVEFNGNYLGLLSHALSDEKEIGLMRIDLAINVHGGITYSRNSLEGISDELFGKLWWFGFDTIHAGDLKPYQTDIDRKYQIHGDEYRTFEYVKDETKKLSEQLAVYK